MLEKRNLLAHTYDEKNFKEALNIILTKYYPELYKLYHLFKSEK
jgi:hypothetical protein